MKISGIIFDKDGTLLDFNEFWIPAAQCVIRRILSDYKIPVTDIHTEKALNSIGIIQNQMIISKNPQFTGISARQQLEFTTHLLLTD